MTDSELIRRLDALDLWHRHELDRLRADGTDDERHVQWLEDAYRLRRRALPPSRSHAPTTIDEENDEEASRED
jgi:hypothetical protein